MRTEEILAALRRLKVETGSLACMGCGREHDCGIHGCRIVREAAELIEKLTDRCARYAEEIAVLQEREKWVPVTERLPEISNPWGVSDVVLCIISRRQLLRKRSCTQRKVWERLKAYFTQGRKQSK